MANKIYVGLLGLGTIGTGVARIIGGHQNKINQVVGQEVVIKTVLDRDLDKCKAFFGDSVHCTDNFDEILQIYTECGYRVLALATKSLNLNFLKA